LPDCVYLPVKSSVAEKKDAHVRLVFKFHYQKKFFRHFGKQLMRINVAILPISFLAGTVRVLNRSGKIFPPRSFLYSTPVMIRGLARITRLLSRTNVPLRLVDLRQGSTLPPEPSVSPRQRMLPLAYISYNDSIVRRYR
jgi:hypothetical protein